MPDEIITIEVKNLDKLQAALHKLEPEITRYMGYAGVEAGKEIISTEGLQKYPPETSANKPPTPYYIRGRGTQYKSKNTGKSERYGTQFYVEAQSYLQTAIGNRASYAEHLGGDKPAEAMANKGWRRLYDVAVEKTTEITAIFQRWIDKAIKDLGL